MKIKNIGIPKKYKENPPSTNKMISYRDYYNKHGEFKSQIVIDGNTLVNGYTTYLLCKEFGIESIDVVSVNYRKSPTVYIFGYHPEDASRKEYVWRLQKDLETGLNYDCEIEAGDIVPVQTKRGDTNIVVTRVQLLNTPPRNGVVKICTLPNGFRRQ